MADFLPQNNPAAAPQGITPLSAAAGNSMFSGSAGNPIKMPTVAPQAPPQATQPVAQPVAQAVQPVAPMGAQDVGQNAVAPGQPTGGTPVINGQPLDPNVLAVVRTIRQLESQGNYNAVGDGGSSMGAYQWNNGKTPVAQGQLPANFVSGAKQFGLDPTDFSPANQNHLAYLQVEQGKQQGLTPMEIDARWNGANYDKATNTYTHINPVRGQQFVNTFEQVKNGTLPAPAQPQAPPTYGATFAAAPGDNALVLGMKALGNIPSSVYGLGAGLINTVAHPIQTVQNLGSAAIGGVENLTGQNAGGTPDQYQQQANAFGQAIMQRYGSLGALKNTLVNDPAGAALDVASLVTGGEGIAAKGADLADFAAGTRAANLVKEGASMSGPAGFASDVGAVAKPQYGTYGTAVRDGISAANQASMAALGKIATPITAIPNMLINKITGGGVDEAALAAAQRTGIELPAIAYSRNPLIQGAEALGAKGAGEGTFVEKIAAVTDKMNQVAENGVAALSGETDPTLVGQSLVKGLNASEKAYKSANAALYGALEEQSGDVAAQTNASIAALTKIVADKVAAGDSTDAAFFKNKLDVLTGGKTQEVTKGVGILDKNGNEITKTETVPKGTQYAPPTFSTLKKLRTAVTDRIKNYNDPIRTASEAQLHSFANSLTSDMRSTLLAQPNGEQLAGLWDKANVTYGDSVDALTAGYANTIRRLAENGQESKILGTLLKPSTAIEDIPKMMQLVGPEGAANIQSAFMKQIIDGARSNPLDPTSDLSAGKMTRALGKYGNDKLAAILPPGQIQQLKDLGTISDAMKTAMSLTKGGVGTGYMVRMALSMRAMAEPSAILLGMYKLATGDPVTGLQVLGGVLGVEGASAFFSSDLGNSVLKWGALHGTEFKNIATQQGLTEQSIGGNVTANDTSNIGGTGDRIPGNAGADSNPSGTSSVGSLGSKLVQGAKKVGALAVQNPQYMGTGVNIANLAAQTGYTPESIQSAIAQGYTPDAIRSLATQ